MIFKTQTSKSESDISILSVSQFWLKPDIGGP